LLSVYIVYLRMSSAKSMRIVVVSVRVFKHDFYILYSS
jgi:hypothetical protein